MRERQDGVRRFYDFFLIDLKTKRETAIGSWEGVIADGIVGFSWDGHKIYFGDTLKFGLRQDSVGKKELKNEASDAVYSLYLKQGGRTRCKKIVSQISWGFKAFRSSR